MPLQNRIQGPAAAHLRVSRRTAADGRARPVLLELVARWALTAGVSKSVSGKALAAGSSSGVKRIRDRSKANATRVLREHSRPVTNEKIWIRGGDIELIDSDADLEQVILYITEAQRPHASTFMMASILHEIFAARRTGG